MKTYSEDEKNNEVKKALAAFIVASAAQYSRGAWQGVDVATDMLKSGGITEHDVLVHAVDKITRLRLIGLLR